MKKTITIPEGVEVRFDNETLLVKGPKGELSREFKSKSINVSVDKNEITLSSDSDRKKVKALLGTWAAHMRNMIIGVTTGWEAKLKVVYSHFPIKISKEDDKIIIQNFLGERKERTAKIPDGVEVDIKKDEIIITGIDKERVGQAAANVELATKIKGYDRRVFQDGCYIVQKCKPIGE
ncbi:MAG: 50S ribosomal protein L6 [Candidatus Aenigmatarchaeota archaeon]|nr:MAG: 50S ribosomal protein L6 [Candidatus Aenigmarchaeota archaeon]